MFIMQHIRVYIANIYLFVVILSSLVNRSYQATTRERDTKAVLDTLLNSYDSRMRPSGINGTDDPVEVTVNMMVLDFTSFSDYDMEYGVQLYFRQEWFDKRLQYEDKGNIHYITLTDISKIWIPDLFFTNEKDAHLHKITSPNVLLRIYPNGNILYSSRVSLTATCHMKLKLYPFDTQLCVLRIESYAYNTRDIKLKWKEENPVQISKHSSVVGFTLTKTLTEACNVTTFTGEYNYLSVSMLFHRQIKYYLLHTFLPSMVLVAIAWGTFFLDRQAVVVRVVVVLSAMFGLSTIAAEVEASVPHVDYVKAMDVWVSGCFSFLLLALLETAWVGAKSTAGLGDEGPATSDAKRRDDERDSSPANVEEVNHLPFYKKVLQTSLKEPDAIDVLASRVFPILYIGFVCVFFYINWI